MIPVPLADRRLRARGHNQAILIAVQVRRILGIPLKRRCAKRIRNTEILADLGPKRAVGPGRARVHSVPLPAGTRVAIVDDVVTTGATAISLAGALKQAGAAEVHLWAPSAAPQPD